MPTSFTQSATRSDGRSIVTPRADKTSALPHFEDTDRLPCFATVKPAPATTNAAADEMLKVWAQSPPVPHVSTTMASPTLIFVARARMARTDPAISSTVSPFHAQAHQIGGDLGRRRSAIHDLRHDLFGFLFREARPIGEFGDGVFDHH